MEYYQSNVSENKCPWKINVTKDVIMQWRSSTRSVTGIKLNAFKKEAHFSTFKYGIFKQVRGKILIVFMLLLSLTYKIRILPPTSLQVSTPNFPPSLNLL